MYTTRTRVGLVPPIQSAIVSETCIPGRERIVERTVCGPTVCGPAPFCTPTVCETVTETFFDPPIIEEHIEYEGPPYEVCRPVYRGGWPYDHYEVSGSYEKDHCCCCIEKEKNKEPREKSKRNRERKIKPLRIGCRNRKGKRITKPTRTEDKS